MVAPNGARALHVRRPSKQIAELLGQGSATLTARAVQRFTGHTAAVSNFELSADGTRLATASSDQTVKLWNVESSVALATFVPGRYSVTKSYSACMVTATSFSPSRSVPTAGIWRPQAGIVPRGSTRFSWTNLLPKPVRG